MRGTLFWRWTRVTGVTIDFQGSWEDYLPLTEFSYNNSFQASIQMAPFDALDGRKCRTPSCWTELGERWVLDPELVSDTEDKVRLIWDRLKVAFDRQIVCRSEETWNWVLCGGLCVSDGLSIEKSFDVWS